MDNKALKIICENLYLSMSVTDGNTPWIFNAYFAFDGVDTFYWYSPKYSKHSKYITKNPKVSLCIFNSTAVGDEVDALYANGIATEVDNLKELSKGLTLYGKKMLKTRFISGKTQLKSFVSNIKDFSGKSPIRLYKVKVEKMWRLAESKIYNEKYVDSRQPVVMK